MIVQTTKILLMLLFAGTLVSANGCFSSPKKDKSKPIEYEKIGVKSLGPENPDDENRNYSNSESNESKKPWYSRLWPWSWFSTKKKNNETFQMKSQPKLSKQCANENPLISLEAEDEKNKINDDNIDILNAEESKNETEDGKIKIRIDDDVEFKNKADDKNSGNKSIIVDGIKEDQKLQKENDQLQGSNGKPNENSDKFYEKKMEREFTFNQNTEGTSTEYTIVHPEVKGINELGGYDDLTNQWRERGHEPNRNKATSQFNQQSHGRALLPQWVKKTERRYHESESGKMNRNEAFKVMNEDAKSITELNDHDDTTGMVSSYPNSTSFEDNENIYKMLKLNEVREKFVAKQKLKEFKEALNDQFYDPENDGYDYFELHKTGIKKNWYDYIDNGKIGMKKKRNDEDIFAIEYNN